MAKWSEFVAVAPELSSFAQARFEDDTTGRITFLSTIRKDGGPRVHPVKVFVAGDGLYLFMYPESPKGADLLRDPRVALHAAVTPNPFVSGEFTAHGRAIVVDDAAERAVAAAAAPFAQPPSDDSVLFAVDLTFALGAFAANGAPVRYRWRDGEATETNIGFGERTS